MKSKLPFLAILFLIACQPKNKNQSYDIPFDFDWKFALEEQLEAEKPDFNDSNWEAVDVPHDFSILQKFNENNSTRKGGGYAHSGIAWYRKDFNLPESAKDKRISITFNGVYKNSEVWINGKYLGKRPNGYLSFTYDLTPFINYNKNNIIAVKVDSKDQPSSRWYTGSGIYRHVSLHVSNTTHLVKNGVFIETEDLKNNKARFKITAEVEGENKKSEAVGLRISVIDPKGETINYKTQTIRVKPDQLNTYTKEISIRNPKKWSINTPNLYSVKVDLIKKKKILDSYTTKCGIRSFKFDPNKGFFLNGEHVKIKGTNNHHDGGPLGSACFDYTFERQLKILKEMGCNALRMSHNPPAPELLDYADSMGFIVIDEIFDEWLYGKVPHNYANDFNEWYEKDIAAWMRRDRNHPSILSWSLGNEIPEQRSGSEGVERLSKLIETAKKHDTSRPFTSACNEIISANESGFTSALDLVGYNYQEANYQKDHASYPNRIIYGSETVIYPYQPGDEFPLHSYNQWLEGQKQDYIAGEFLWTGFDYLGESGIGMGGLGIKPWEVWPSWPYRSAVCGVIDICGFEKPGYWFRKALWSNKPVLFVAVPTDTTANNLNAVPFWGWPNVQAHWNYNKIGEKLKVQVYSNCKELELFLNGKSLGTKSLDIWEEAFLTWDVAFEPGTIEAIGKTESNKQINFKLETAGNAAKMKLNCDRQAINANKQDVSYCKLEILDENDNPVPFAKNIIHFSISGPGKLAAVGNGDPQSHTPFKGDQMETYLGKCLAIVQSTNERGEIILTASSEGMESISVTILSEK